MQKWFCLSQLLFPAQEQLAIVVKMLGQKQNTRNLPKTFLSKDALHLTIILEFRLALHNGMFLYFVCDISLDFTHLIIQHAFCAGPLPPY